MTARPAPARLATPGGVLTLEPLVPDATTVELLHAWLTHSRSRFWDLLDADPERVRRTFAAVAEDPHCDAWLARLDGVPLGLVETYDPGAVLLPGHYAHRPSDVGMHLLLAPASSSPTSRCASTLVAMPGRSCFRSVNLLGPNMSSRTIRSAQRSPTRSSA